jgi:hypothetical protein
MRDLCLAAPMSVQSAEDLATKREDRMPPPTLARTGLEVPLQFGEGQEHQVPCLAANALLKELRSRALRGTGAAIADNQRSFAGTRAKAVAACSQASAAATGDCAVNSSVLFPACSFQYFVSTATVKRPAPPLFKPLEPNSDRLEPASPTVPAPTENDHEDDENDQKHRGVHLCLLLLMAPIYELSAPTRAIQRRRAGA